MNNFYDILVSKRHAKWVAYSHKTRLLSMCTKRELEFIIRASCLGDCEQGNTVTLSCLEAAFHCCPTCGQVVFFLEGESCDVIVSKCPKWRLGSPAVLGRL